MTTKEIRIDFCVGVVWRVQAFLWSFFKRSVSIKTIVFYQRQKIYIGTYRAVTPYKWVCLAQSECSVVELKIHAIECQKIIDRCEAFKLGN